MFVLALAGASYGAYAPHMTRFRTVLLGLSAWPLLAACGGAGTPSGEMGEDVAGGQTGSASCGTDPECVCDVASRSVLARAEVLESFEDHVSLRVTAVVTPETRLITGDLLEGPYQLGFPCGLGLELAIEPGSEVLVAVDLGNLYVVPWQLELFLADGATLESRDLDLLLDSPTCRAYFTSSIPSECAR